jgi:G3E family GTPase
MRCLGDKSLMRRFRLGQVITTVDAVQGLQQLQAHIVSRKQASVAEHLVITKTDMADAEGIACTWSVGFGNVNPYAQMTESVSGQAAAKPSSPSDLLSNTFKLLPQAFNEKSNGNTHGADIGSWSVFSRHSTHLGRHLQLGGTCSP